MKKLRNILGILGVMVISLLLVGCNNTNSKDNNVEGSLADIMTKLYTGIADDQKPMLGDIELNAENFENYAFVSNVKYKEALANEPMMGSIPHSVVLIRLENANDASEVVRRVKENANPRKWICVEAENVIVKAKGDLVILIMSNELAEPIEKNFDNL